MAQSELSLFVETVSLFLFDQFTTTQSRKVLGLSFLPFPVEKENNTNVFVPCQQPLEKRRVPFIGNLSKSLDSEESKERICLSCAV